MIEPLHLQKGFLFYTKIANLAFYLLCYGITAINTRIAFFSHYAADVGVYQPVSGNGKPYPWIAQEIPRSPR